MRTARQLDKPRQSGFTLLEVLVVVAVVGILLMITAPAFLNMINRYKLTGTAREVAALMQAARLESIKMSSTAQVTFDETANAFVATLATGRQLSGTVPMPVKVEFRGPGDAAPNGTNAIDGWDDDPAQDGPIFSPDGSVDRVGAFRFKDSNDNYLEVRVETPATGRIVLRKYDSGEDAFLLNGEGGHRWVWN